MIIHRRFRDPRALRSAALAGVLALAACGDSTRPVVGGGDVDLAPGQFSLLAGSQAAGALSFPAAGSAGAEYLVVAQFATGTPDVSTGFTLGSVTVGAAPAPAAPSPLAAAVPAARRFHDLLREREARLARDAQGAAPAAARASERPLPAPPLVGDRRTFRVCGDIDCSTLKNTPATARFVGTHAAIFVDDSAPADGFTDPDLLQVGQQFDQHLHPVAHDAFASESDIDANGVVMILLTKRVNSLVGRPECEDAYVTGFFYGADLAPTTRAAHNNGEVFYGMVPDPSGTVGCAFSRSLVRAVVPTTFIHEFQHMISFNQHVLVRNGPTEELWLNEALSHLSEELAARHYDSLDVDTTASRFYIGNLYNAFQYLRAPPGAALVTETPPGSLAERGAAWLFARYLLDRFGAGTARSLVATGQTGAANVAAATGTAFGTLVGRWSLAIYVSDLAGFTAPSDLRYENWRFRTTFASLHAQAPADFDRPFPLVPTAATGGTVAVGGTLRSGTGSYVLVTQAAGAPGFDLTFRPATGTAFPTAAAAQVAVVRIR